MGRVREEKRREAKRSEAKRRRSKRESLRRKKIQAREKVGKSLNTLCFPMICGSGGSKSRLAKAAVAEPAGQMRDEKLHAAVVRSTFRSQNVQYATQTNCSNRSRVGIQGHLSQMILGTNQSQQ